MDKITYNKASPKGIKALSKKAAKLLEDKTGKLYQDNVVKFGIPEEVVKRVFSEESLLETAQSGKATFYLALKNGCKILGFAQVARQNSDSLELERIVVFPEYERRGIGTGLLQKVIADQKKNIKRISVTAGKDEAHARVFYEKNGFKQLREEMLEFPWGKKSPVVVYCYQMEGVDKKNCFPSRIQ
jgi:N-acetylglutamate synthase-like GNAT family acetyltransferase